MKTSTRFILATGLASLVGLTMLPTAYAQGMGAPKDAPPMLQLDNLGNNQGDDDDDRDDRRGGPRGERGGIAGLTCSTDGASQLETRLADLATQLKLTTEQQALFDAYKTAALSAQTTFADTCAKVQPVDAKPAARPDALTVLKDRHSRQTAGLDALNAVLPSFEALYNSLDDTQKAALLPLVGPHFGPGDHGPRGDDRGDRAGRHDDRDGDDNRGRKGRHDGRHGMMIQPSADTTSAVTAG
jgi:hypothetical protein